ncbi:MAG: glycosyltransferase family protein [Vicinamibacterales bacterium]|jgi:spore coat polysaccharide biosynthesis protein SpsF
MAGPKVVASIEARMGSTRLPGKVLHDIDGKPALGRLVHRLRQCRSLNDVIVATSTAAGDDPIAAWCAGNGVRCFRGSEDDVLGRVVGAHQSAGSDLIVEITGDCPLTDPAIVDLGVETFLANDVDVVTNCGSILTWPMGQYVQVFPLALLDEINRTSADPAVHEHVSLYFYEHPERYRILNLVAPSGWEAPQWRMQLDYPEDLQFQEEVHRRLTATHGDAFGIEPLMVLLRAHPELVQINLHCEEKAAR